VENPRKHFDYWDMIGMYVGPGLFDDNGQRLTYPWVDGGDSCHFMGLYYYAYFAYPAVRLNPHYSGNMQLRLTQSHNLLESKSFFGGLKRHPDARYWYGGNGVGSRDQATPFLAALAISGQRKGLLKELWGHLKRGLLFTTNVRKNGSSPQNHGSQFNPDAKPLQPWEKFALKYKIPMVPIRDGYRNYNWKLPDLTLFDYWSLYIRGFNAWYLYPILLLGDAQLLINALLIKKNKEDTDVANFFIKHSLSSKILPTPFSAITQKYLLPKLNLEGRFHKNYYRPGELRLMPTFLCEILKN